MWFDGGELESVVTRRALRELFESAQGKVGRCKSCGLRLEGVQACTACRAPAPACPECRLAPLSVSVARGVRLDVCLQCRGIWLDADELKLLAGCSGTPLIIQNAAMAAIGKGPDSCDSRKVCASCSRELSRARSFEDAGHVYCGSCAPAGSSPVVFVHVPVGAQFVVNPGVRRLYVRDRSGDADVAPSSYADADNADADQVNRVDLAEFFSMLFG